MTNKQIKSNNNMASIIILNIKHYMVYTCIYSISKKHKSPVLSSNDCFIKVDSFSTCLGADRSKMNYFFRSQKYSKNLCFP